MSIQSADAHSANDPSNMAAKSAQRSYDGGNWPTPPLNRISFQGLQPPFPIVQRKRGSEALSPLPSMPDEIGPIQVVGLHGEARFLSAMLNETYTDAFFIARNGNLIHEEYRNGMQADSVHWLSSISKTFVGILAGSLVRDEALNPNAPEATHAPCLSRPALHKHFFDDERLGRSADLIMVGMSKNQKHD